MLAPLAFVWMVVPELPRAVVARAQDEEGSTERRDVAVSVVLVPEGNIDRADLTRIEIGVRRGVGEIAGTRFVHPADSFSAQAVPEAVQAAAAELDAIAEALRAGDAATAGQRARAAIDVFEANLETVRRADLLDAYMLAALADCERGAERRCTEGMQRVVVVRETFEYDPVRYPEAHLPLFERVREQLVVHGARGALEVHTEPPGAEVYVDGRSVGPSPAVVEGLLVGQHYVTVKALGYRKQVVRVEVNDTFQERVDLELVADDRERSLLLLRDLPRIRAEIGARRAGRFISGLSAYLFVQQVVLGTVRRRDGRFALDLHVYDLRTRHRLAHRSVEVPGGEQTASRVRRIVAEMYRGVRLDGTVAPPDEGTGRRTQPLYARWWFWTAVGVVAASGVVAVIVASSAPQASGPPPGFVRFDGRIE
ncbi:MAG: PEGA domain-containing protein [Myxococcales bacterium]|nr:PEGA domain-containing protein [Myxococcales bacterium]